MFYFSKTILKTLSWMKIFHFILRIPEIFIVVSIVFLHSAVDIRAADSERTDNLKPVNAEIKTARKKAENIDRKLEKQTTILQAFALKEISVINSFNETDLALNDARKKSSALKSELALLEKNFEQASGTYNALKKRTEISKNYVSRRLVAAYKINLLGEMNVLASAESINEFFYKKIIMKRILDYDRKIREQFIKDMAVQKQMLNRIDAQKKEKLSLEQVLNSQISIMSRENEKRTKILGNIKNKKKLRLAAIEALKQTAAELDHKIRSFAKMPDQPSKKVENTLPETFSSLKGLLKMPVKGKITRFFGRHKKSSGKTESFKAGIDIKADRGEPICSVYNGQILYSSWFKSYGNMIIIDHGNHFYTVYAHAEELFKSKGDYVKAGEVIATVGDTGSMMGPELYFELRHHGKPVNPLEWINS